jgi:hypothetical protein
MDGQAKKSKVELTWCAPHTASLLRHKLLIFIESTYTNPQSTSVYFVKV